VAAGAGAAPHPLARTTIVTMYTTYGAAFIAWPPFCSIAGHR
jgi:hypothetical protein